MTAFGSGFQTTEYDEFYNLRLWSYIFTDFQTSGVETLSSEAVNDSCEVYNLQGIKVATLSAAEDINSLPAGIYIVGGKKIAVRK